MKLSEARAITEKKSIENGDDEIVVINKTARLVLAVRKTTQSNTGFSRYNLYVYTRPDLNNTWSGIIRRESTDAEDALRWLGSEDGVEVEPLDIINVLYNICADIRLKADFTPERIRDIARFGERVRKVTNFERKGEHIHFNHYSVEYDISFDGICICINSKAFGHKYETKIDITEPDSIERFEKNIENAMLSA